MPDKVDRPARLCMPDYLSKGELKLYEGVMAALMALPVSFSFPYPVGGIKAVDLFNLSSLIGATIEDQVVNALNRTRSIWDSEHEWEDCMFVRKSQSFPDVRLTRQTLEGSETVLGIELKGWYALSKERVPSFRYQIAVDACATMDLICVVPWYLDNAVSGEAKVLAPWVEQARYAAEWRDYWWEHVRDCKGGAESRRVIQPESVSPYPSKADAAHAVPVSDSGGNFGRLPRAKPLMDSFIERVMKEEVLGIPLEDWVCFISMHTDSSDPEAITAKLASKVKEEGLDLSEQKAAELLCVLRKLTDFNFG